MENMREIAKAYYERSTEQEKRSARAFFEDLDADHDGKVSLVELKKAVPWSCISNENVFRQLDENGDGTLDFDEVLAVYYMVNKVDLMLCSGCYALLSGPYFSCRLCLGNPRATFDLCCGCHRSGKVVHEHPSSSMLDHHSLIAELKNSHQKTQPKAKEMEELREISRAHYQAGSSEVQGLACEFYQSMDTNCDGEVELSEFLEFMTHEGYLEMQNAEFFRKLDLDSNGILDFSEVMMLYYIIKSGRPFCYGCKKFIPGVFFSCVDCFKPPKTPFNLCRDCYQSKNFSHSHNGGTQFLDNYTLLEATRNSNVGMNTTSVNPTPERSPIPDNNAIVLAPNYPMVQAQHTNNAYNIHPSHPLPYNAIVPYNAHVVSPLPPLPPPVPHYTNAIVVAPNRWDKCKAALQALEIALHLGTFAAAGCTIL